MITDWERLRGGNKLTTIVCFTMFHTLCPLTKEKHKEADISTLEIVYNGATSGKSDLFSCIIMTKPEN